MLPNMATKTKLAKHSTRCSDAASRHSRMSSCCTVWHGIGDFDSIAAWRDHIHQRRINVSAQGIDMGMLKREDVFVTTKLWNDDHDRVEDAMDDSLKVASCDLRIAEAARGYWSVTAVGNCTDIQQEDNGHRQLMQLSC